MAWTGARTYTGGVDPGPRKKPSPAPLARAPGAVPRPLRPLAHAAWPLGIVGLAAGTTAAFVAARAVEEPGEDRGSLGGLGRGWVRLVAGPASPPAVAAPADTGAAIEPLPPTSLPVVAGAMRPVHPSIPDPEACPSASSAAGPASAEPAVFDARKAADQSHRELEELRQKRRRDRDRDPPAE